MSNLSRHYDLYERYQREHFKQISKTTDQKKHTITAVGMPIVTFMQWVSTSSRYSMVVNKDLDDELITIEVIDQPMELIIQAIARRINVEVLKIGDIYYLGDLKPADRAISVRKVRGLSVADISNLYQTVSGEFGQVHPLSDGTVIFSDSIPALQRVTELLDQLDRRQSDVWIIQLYLLAIDVGKETQYGVRVDTDINFAAGAVYDQDFLKLDPNLITKDYLGIVDIQGVIEANRSIIDSDNVINPFFMLSDGQQVSYTSAETIPVPRRTVSDQGTVTTAAFDFIEAGLIIDVALREHSIETASLSLSIEISDVTGSVEGAPITNVNRYETVTDVDSGKLYLVGRMSRTKKIHNRSIDLGIFTQESDTGSDLQIWCKAFRLDHKPVIQTQRTESPQDLIRRLQKKRTGSP